VDQVSGGVVSFLWLLPSPPAVTPSAETQSLFGSVRTELELIVPSNHVPPFWPHPPIQFLVIPIRYATRVRHSYRLMPSENQRNNIRHPLRKAAHLVLPSPPRLTKAPKSER
jgi:hypothetical protein